MKARDLVAGVVPVVAAAVVGGAGSRNAPRTYARLRKPAWAPPAAVFGPVWTTLYALIATAGVRIAARGDRTTQTLQYTQLVLNGAWPLVFFARGQKAASLAVIGALDAVLLAELARLRREDPTAAALLAPYAAWSAFATALNAAVSEP